MLKNYRKFLTAGVLAFGLAACGDDLTITEPAPPPPPPETPNIVSFSVAPTNATIAVGQTIQASFNLQTKAGVAGTVAFSTGNGAVASVDPATGLITAISNGTALITATATAGGQTATAQIGVTVRQLAPAQISIQSVTTGNTATPVALNNVNGQIEVNMNFDAGEQTVDSVNVFIGAKRAAKQSFVTNPAAGIISLSINTANYTKNTTTGVATVDYQNGASTISAAVYPRGGAATATNTIAVVLNNMDGFAADMSAPTAFTNNAGGLTYWGGPTAGGQTTVTVYPVIYTAGRSISSVNFGLTNLSGACNQTDTSLPFRTTFGASVSTPGTNCNQQYVAGAENNVVINSSIDNTNNNGPTNLIANTVVPGSIPASLRFDWLAPTTTTLPAVAGAHGFNWVNNAWSFAGAGATDAGVGMPATPVYNRFRTGTTTPAITSGADLAETNTNDATDGHRLFFTTADRLGNVATSANTAYFGVDRTAPTIRYASTTTLTNVRTYSLPADTVTVVNAPAGGNPLTLWAVEAIDNRAGLFDTPNTGTTRGVDQGVIRLAPGAIGTQVAVAGDDNYAATLGDGYRQTVAVPVWGSAGGQTNTTPGYYTYTVTIRDRAGNAVDLSNATGAIAQRRYAIDPAAPVVTGIGVPATFGTDLQALAGAFTIAAQDDLEVIGTRLGFSFPDAVTGGLDQPIIFPASTFTNVGIRYDGTLAGAIATAQNLTTPVLSTVTSPDFWAGAQVLCPMGGTCSDGADVEQGEPVVAGATYKPDSVSVSVTDVFGTSSPTLAAAILSTSVPATTELAANVYAGGFITGNGIQVRYLSGTTIRQVSSFSVTLPQLSRLHAFRLIAGEWVFQGTVQGSAGTGSDNGQERFWDYNFGTALTPAGTYAIVAVYNGPVTAARGTALVYTFSK